MDVERSEAKEDRTGEQRKARQRRGGEKGCEERLAVWRNKHMKENQSRFSLLAIHIESQFTIHNYYFLYFFVVVFFQKIVVRYQKIPTPSKRAGKRVTIMCLFLLYVVL